ncbi:MAG: enoyl-CoA hydratase/isomerase family protein [Ilumatobacteraceae bacterium]
MSERTWTTIEVVPEGRVTWVRFNRPEHNNSLGPGTVEEVFDALDAISRDDGTDVVVLTGNGRSFCPGADVGAASASVAAGQPAEPVLPPVALYHSSTLLREMPQVTVAAINGACAGAGMAWASACDLRIASSRARFATALFSLGLASELGMVWTLQRDLGTSVAKELCFFPRKLDAAELRALGYLHRVFDADTFDADSRQLVAELASRGSAAIRTLKADFVDAARLGLREYIDVETPRHQAFFTGDAAAGSRARLAARAQEIGGASS